MLCGVVTGVKSNKHVARNQRVQQPKQRFIALSPRSGGPKRLSAPRVGAPDYASRYEHVGTGDRCEGGPLLAPALLESHTPRRKTERN